MTQLLDRQYALQILKMLATPFKKMDAYKLGIIDGDGNVLKKSYQLRTKQEKEAYNYLTRLVVILKKAIEKQEKRGDFTLTKALSPALWLVREHTNSNSKSVLDVERQFQKLFDADITLVEEEILVASFLEEEGEGGAPTNNTAGVAGLKANDGPVIHQKDIKKFRTMARRSMPGLKDFMSKATPKEVN